MAGCGASDPRGPTSVIATFSVPAEQFELGRVLEVRRGVRIRLETMVPAAGMVIPYFRVKNEDTEAVERALSDAPIVEEVAAVDRTEEKTLIRVDWSSGVDGLIGAGARGGRRR